MKKNLDLVVYGATGFTGRLAALYLAANAPAKLRWALAGRNVKKLAEVKAQLVAVNPALASLPILEASAESPSSLETLATAARVVLTTVGPYALYGEPLVKACATFGADYVDITGEPQFVADMIEKYDRVAIENKARIVHCCGFDSIPHDVGAYYTVKHLGDREPITLSGFVRSGGSTLSGGTWQSVVNGLSQGRKGNPSVPRRSTHRTVASRTAKLHYASTIKAWACPLPTIDGPIVLRSASTLEAYGPSFSYVHYAHVKHLATVVGAAVGLGAVAALAQFAPTKRLLEKARPSGQGPNDVQLKNGWFQVTFEGTTPSQRIVTRVKGGEPGYAETSKMVAECALALALDRTRLPERYGVLTPVAALEDVLLERLQRAGIGFEVLESRP
jgi:short subunit dehydrogenase-like uncharacterized protein